MVFAGRRRMIMTVQVVQAVQDVQIVRIVKATRECQLRPVGTLWLEAQVGHASQAGRAAARFDSVAT